MTRLGVHLLVTFGFLIYGAGALAQDANAAADYNPKFSAYNQEGSLGCGVLLANSVPGINNVLSLCGLRYGFKVGQQTVLESSLFDGNGYGDGYIMAGEDFRYDMPIDDLMASFYGGLDLHYASPQGASSSFYVGADAGTALWFGFSDSFYFRTDLKLLLNPGTSLFLGLSFDYRFDNGGGG